LDRIRIAVIVGVAFCIGGILLCLDASNLATQWEMIGANAWGGTTDPDNVHAYQLLGQTALGFGAVVLSIALAAWVSFPEASRGSRVPYIETDS